MRIESVRIKGFRCFDEETVSLRDFTVLVGRNSAGKSSVLHALGHFYSPAKEADDRDFHGGYKPSSPDRDDASRIEIAVTFAELSETETREFQAYVEGGKLRVMKVYEAPGKGEYYGFKPQIPAFAQMRRFKGKAFNDLYRETYPRFSGLPAGRSEQERRDALAAYEREHPADCTMEQQQEQFFGTVNVGGGKLDNYTGFIFVPAVRDASELGEGSKGPIGDLILRVLMPEIEGKAEVARLREDVNKRLGDIFDGSNKDDLPKHAKQVSDLLADYAPGSTLNLRWSDVSPVKLPYPDIIRSVTDDGWPGPIQKSGHGLQRALIIALLQYENERRRTQAPPITPGQDVGETSQPPSAPVVIPQSVIFAIEEPELYLHPSRCRHLSSILVSLAEREKRDFQVVCATHSPFFVALSRFPSVRIVRKHPCRNPAASGPRQTRVSMCDDGRAAKRLAAALKAEHPENYTGARLLTNLGQVLYANPVVTEGFFADVAVLVEGETDFGVLSECARRLGKNWERLGIVVLPCGGKNSMSRPLLVFSELDIPTFTLFDGDKAGEDAEQGAADNQVLMRLCGVESPVEWPGDGIEPSRNYAAFEARIEVYLKGALGDEYDRTLAPIAREIGRKAPEAIKSRDAAGRLIRDVSDEGFAKLTLLHQIVEHVTKLADGVHAHSARPLAPSPVVSAATTTIST